MTAHSLHSPTNPLKLGLRAASALAGLALASCTAAYSPPQEVQASNPTVTYTYQGDQALLQANQSAATFCTRYQRIPSAASFTTDSSGNKVVTFQCVPATTTVAAAAPPEANSNLTYTYQTDQQLLDDSRNARMYCSSVGAQSVTSNVVDNPDGSRTVTFACAPQ
jgi:hypothetical protein